MPSTPPPLETGDGRPAIVANPGAGSATTLDELRAAFGDDVDLVEVEDDDLPAALEKALAGAPAWLGVCGGDGSIRCAAARTAGGTLPLLAVPGGTRNHFAKALGFPTLADAAAAVAAGRTERVDIGRVAAVADDGPGEIIINTSSTGVYARVVRERFTLKDRLPKRVADVIGAWHQVRRGKPQHVVLDGQPYRAWMVFVGPSPYGEGMFAFARDSLTAGRLDLVVARADARFARTRLLLAAVLGRLSTTPVTERGDPTSVRLEVRGKTEVDVAIDGDVECVQLPLRWWVEPASLLVFVAPDAAV